MWVLLNANTTPWESTMGLRVQLKLYKSGSPRKASYLTHLLICHLSQRDCTKRQTPRPRWSLFATSPASRTAATRCTPSTCFSRRGGDLKSEAACVLFSTLSLITNDGLHFVTVVSGFNSTIMVIPVVYFEPCYAHWTKLLPAYVQRKLSSRY